MTAVSEGYRTRNAIYSAAKDTNISSCDKNREVGGARRCNKRAFEDSADAESSFGGFGRQGMDGGGEEPQYFSLSQESNSSIATDDSLSRSMPLGRGTAGGPRQPLVPAAANDNNDEWEEPPWLLSRDQLMTDI